MRDSTVLLKVPSMSIYGTMLMQCTNLCIAHYSHKCLESDPLSESFAAISDYFWKSSFTAASGKNTTQYRMMLESTPSLEDGLADCTNITWLAMKDKGIHMCVYVS